MKHPHLQKCFPKLSTFRNAHNDTIINKLLEMCTQSGQQTTSRISELIYRAGQGMQPLESWIQSFHRVDFLCKEGEEVLPYIRQKNAMLNWDVRYKHDKF
jgi:hypothetical protein